MKIYFYNQYAKDRNTTYTLELIKHLALRNGHQIAPDPQGADFVAVSMSHHTELKMLRKIRAMTNTPIVAGGHASYAPNSILCYSDFVNLGQGFQFFKEIQKFDDLYEKPYIYHRNKRHGTISHFIDWSLVPLIQIGKNTYSYLWSLGCKNKCYFCLTSWMNEYQVNPNNSLMEYARAQTKGKQLYMITNDHSGATVKRAVSDVMVRDYIRDPAKFQKITLIRVGIESVKESTRKFLGKNITDEEIQRFFYLTKEHGKAANFFLMAGFDSQDDWIRFAEILPRDYDKRPRIGAVVNYFAPNYGTPLEDYDITQTQAVDFKKVIFHWIRKNARIRIFNSNAIKPYGKMWECLIERSNTLEQIERIYALQKKVYKIDQFPDFLNDLSTNGLLAIAQGKYEKARIEFPYQDKKENIIKIKGFDHAKITEDQYNCRRQND